MKTSKWHCRDAALVIYRNVIRLRVDGPNMIVALIENERLGTLTARTRHRLRGNQVHRIEPR